ncbi:DUF305 domain-containing protein [Streptomyces rapamycinicus]|uniref:DUF305 domain-containing protein n=2 Tax=Streptomyces rapamycinicus TaxID=1226757 RepID=A0A0A0NAG0_STRRN|nr:DUF305 domain-containing protein [Streptomyces rapamycinicus]AGP56417.1 hypothetical protein M271_24615 [Streptomyces rapamycinicus NRRL 5491]MBB4784016.1 uncharacterized protein (DUF305 family) [Streptomyces rapamycinicus]RLV80499.1 hypothetical protein D3C57_118980 [Streptomyces rapamycinicus NRRL 5491]UTO64362.1 DUF305 domain-containing protein [Streptomyces rapamycinicus]UTP32317.1 DUF305 domain-containing protein [Streptomyces rapamycinicus NRRL 5491]
MSDGTAVGRASRQPLVAGIAAALALLTLVAVAVLWLTSDRSEGSTDTGTPKDTSAEAGFARDMSVHHQQAVEMSFIVRDRTDDDEVRRLAFDIASTQATQAGMLQGWLDMWGLDKTSEDPPMTWMKHASSDGMEGMDHGSMKGMGSTYKPHDGSLMPGMATNSQLDELRKAKGKAAEVLYLKLMTAHHKGGVDMAKGAVELVKDSTEKHLARTMVQGQQSEIQLMADMLKARGASSS